MQCSHYHSDTGKRCRAEATSKVWQWLSDDRAAPKKWECLVCNNHSASYIHSGNYKVEGLVQHG